MNRKICLLSAGLLVALATWAEDTKDSAYIALYHRYYSLYDTDSVDEFYEASGQLQQRYLDRGQMLNYYKIRQNEIFFDAAHDKSYQAIRKSTELLDDMKNSKTKYYELPYLSLGYIFESQGTYRIAVHYYQEALANIGPKDSTGQAHIFSQLASVNLTRQPDKAWEWNERLRQMISSDSLYYKVYLAMKGQICFFKGDKDGFFKAKRELEDFSKRKPLLDHNGEYLLTAMEKAFLGKYDEALRTLDGDTPESDDIKHCDIRIQMYRMMGRGDWALKEAGRRRVIRDSLNNNLLFNSLNEINATINVAKLQEAAAEERERWLVAVIALLLSAFALATYRYVCTRRYERKVERQNKQLAVVLEQARESDRMKNVFIKHISHEIRTPLNIITGYAQVITNPAFDLGAEERNRMVQAIGHNTVTMTDIVNDLLELSQEEDRERYAREDRIAVNAFCRRIVGEMEAKDKGRLQFSFRTDLPDDFTILSNQAGIGRILQQLLGNALKFTEQGLVELAVWQSGGNDLQFVVTDTGTGIPEEQHQQVFENFYKLDSFKQGLGIGLSISRKIAVCLGGTLTIDKTYRDGTRMVLTIPVAGGSIS